MDGSDAPSHGREDDWVPTACTLPTPDRALRVAEFDDLIARALRAQERVSPTRLHWVLESSAETAARDLTEREASCCSFFTFTITRTGTDRGEALVVDIDVPPTQTDVLEAIEQRAHAGMNGMKGPA